jgi:uncharacterized protein YdeI (YjbR/CyaY-like superfamily)
MNAKVDAYIAKAKNWQEEFEKLREIALDCPLTEDFKWGHPCYTHEDANIVLIHGFKEYCALLFFKGVLLKDPKGILITQTENTQTARQLRFTNAAEISRLKSTIKTYIREAIAVEKSGIKVSKKETADFAVAEEFQRQLDAMSALRAAFEALTPGRQRAYLLHFSGAKLSKTREARVEKCIPLILDGLGLDD